MTDPQNLINHFHTLAENAIIRQQNLGFLTWDSSRQRSFLSDLLRLIAKHRPPETSLALVNMFLDLLRLRRRRSKHALTTRLSLIGHLIDRGLITSALRMLPRLTVHRHQQLRTLYFSYNLFIYRSLVKKQAYKTALRLCKRLNPPDLLLRQLRIATEMWLYGEKSKAITLVHRLSRTPYIAETIEDQVRHDCRWIHTFLNFDLLNDAAQKWDALYIQNYPSASFSFITLQAISSKFMRHNDAIRARQAAQLAYRYISKHKPRASLHNTLKALKSLRLTKPLHRRFEVFIRELERKADRIHNIDTRLETYSALAAVVFHEITYRPVFERIIAKIQAIIPLKSHQHPPLVETISNVFNCLVISNEWQRIYDLINLVKSPWHTHYFMLGDFLETLRHHGEHQKSEMLLQSEWERIINASPDDEIFTKISKAEVMADLANAGLTAGMVYEVMKLYPLIPESATKTNFHERLLETLGDIQDWDKVFILLASSDIDVIIETVVSVEQSLDTLRPDLAFEILSDCITIAARTHPEWAGVAAILNGDETPTP